MVQREPRVGERLLSQPDQHVAMFQREVERPVVETPKLLGCRRRPRPTGGGCRRGLGRLAPGGPRLSLGGLTWGGGSVLGGQPHQPGLQIAHHAREIVVEAKPGLRRRGLAQPPRSTKERQRRQGRHGRGPPPARPRQFQLARPVLLPAVRRVPPLPHQRGDNARHQGRRGELAHRQCRRHQHPQQGQRLSPHHPPEVQRDQADRREDHRQAGSPGPGRRLPQVEVLEQRPVPDREVIRLGEIHLPGIVRVHIHLRGELPDRRVLAPINQVDRAQRMHVPRMHQQRQQAGAGHLQQVSPARGRQHLQRPQPGAQQFSHRIQGQAPHPQVGAGIEVAPGHEHGNQPPQVARQCRGTLRGVSSRVIPADLPGQPLAVAVQPPEEHGQPEEGDQRRLGHQPLVTGEQRQCPTHCRPPRRTVPSGGVHHQPEGECHQQRLERRQTGEARDGVHQPDHQVEQPGEVVPGTIGRRGRKDIGPRGEHAVTGEVLPGLDVHQCRGFANLGRPQQERGENHRPPQHEVAADRLVFHQLGGQFFVIFEVFRGFGRRGSGSVTSSDRRHLAPGGVPSLGGRGARGSGAGGGRGPSQGGDPIPFRVGRLGSFGRCHAECSQNRGGRPPVRPNSRVGPGGAGGPEKPARSEEGSGAGTSDSTQFPPEMWETPPASRCYGDDQTRVKPTDHPGRRSEVPFCRQNRPTCLPPSPSKLGMRVRPESAPADRSGWERARQDIPEDQRLSGSAAQIVIDALPRRSTLTIGPD